MARRCLLLLILAPAILPGAGCSLAGFRRSPLAAKVAKAEPLRPGKMPQQPAPFVLRASEEIVRLPPVVEPFPLPELALPGLAMPADSHSLRAGDWMESATVGRSVAATSPPPWDPTWETLQPQGLWNEE